MLPEDVANYLGIQFHEEAWLDPFLKHFKKANFSSHGKRIQRVDLYTFCSAINLSILDQTSMLYGIEGRLPFLSKRFLEWSMSNKQLSITQPSKNLLRKYLMNKVDPRVLSIEKRGFRILGDHKIEEVISNNPFLTQNPNLNKQQKQSINFINHWYESFSKS